MDKVRHEIVARQPKEFEIDVSEVPMFSGGWKQAPVMYEISGPELAELEKYSKQLLDRVRKVPGAVDVNNFAVSFGQNAESNTGGKRFWNGDIDEVRISATARDAAWMFAEHHTVTDPDFVQLGADEPYAP